MEGSFLNHLRQRFPIIVNPMLNNKFQNRLRILQQACPMTVDSNKFQNRLRILNSASSRWSRANMNVRKVSIDTVQDLPEKASMKAKPASIINSNGKNWPKVQSYSAVSAGQMDSCIHARSCMNSAAVALAITQAAIRRGTRAHHSHRIVLGYFPDVTNEYMAATAKLILVKMTRVLYSIRPLPWRIAPSKISISFLKMLFDTKHAAGAMSFGTCVLLVGA